MRPVWAFDLDHTLVRSPLDLGAMRADVRALARARGVDLPDGAAAWTVAQTIAAVGAKAEGLEAECWAIARRHESQALGAAAAEPGAREALATLQGLGCGLAVWTNNTRDAAEHALHRCGLRAFFSALVTRDEAPLKPDPAGLALLRAAFPGRAVWVVGDSWIDGAAAHAGGAPFFAYRADAASLRQRGVAPHAHIEDLRRLAEWALRPDPRDGGAARLVPPPASRPPIM